MMGSAIIVRCLLAAIALEVVTCENQRCYICIPNIGSSIADVTLIFPSGPSLPLCNGFQKDKKEYIRECPTPKYVGCLTQTNGTHITKTCSTIEVQDCKTANKIEYCYCKGQLCNDQGVPAEEARPPVTPGSGTGDDDEDTESYMEGSGSSEESPKERSRHPNSDDIGVDVPSPATVRTSLAAADTNKAAAPAAASSAPNLSSYLICLYSLAFLVLFRLKNQILLCCD